MARDVVVLQNDRLRPLIRSRSAVWFLYVRIRLGSLQRNVTFAGEDFNHNALFMGIDFEDEVTESVHRNSGRKVGEFVTGDEDFRC